MNNEDNFEITKEYLEKEIIKLQVEVSNLKTATYFVGGFAMILVMLDFIRNFMY